jgi:Family of unknown function (DUF6240)
MWEANMNVNNKIDLNSINNKLEFSNTQKTIKGITQKMFGQDAFKVDSSDSKNQLFKMGENSQEDIMEAMAGNPSEFVKGALTALGNTATSKDLTDLDEAGYDLENDKVDTIVTVTDKIQIYLATHCEDYEVVGDISDEAIKEVAGNSQTAAQIAKKLQESNLPITKDNIEDSEEALDIASKLQPISDGTAKYIINNGLAPTIENIYKAEYSGLGSTGGTYAAGFFSEGTGYYGKTSDEFDWNGLKEQMSKVIENAGLEVNEDTLSDAKWLMENHIPLTKESLNQYETLKSLTLPVSQEEVLNSIIQAMQEGKRPSQALVTDEPSFATRAEEAYQIIHNTTDEGIKSVIVKDLPVTIEQLKKTQINETQINETDEGKGTATVSNTSSTLDVSEDNIAYITARRQLEEIRLQMTAEANYKLLKQGISIETTDLKTLVEELKNAEDFYYKQLLKNSDMEESAENISSLKDITTKLSDIKYIPSTVLGSVVLGETQNTINGIYQSGTALKKTYDAANQSYEALMTKPRSDMGDKISKAFHNVDDILSDLGLEKTESNQRAIRILGYNSMDITTENINAVKTVDAAVNQTISNLTPKLVLNMIREGINPLDTNIDELNTQISSMKSQLGEDNTQEKYSEFLWRLEQNSEITTQERQAFIGMYRLLNNVEKTDGQVIGALVNQNADITLNNLLTGVRTIKNKGVDVKVDDSFGELESLTFQANSISDQLSASFGSQSGQSQGQTNGQETEAAMYYNNLVDAALRDITPDKLSQVFVDGNVKDMSLEQFTNEITKAKDDEAITEEFYKEQLEIVQKASQVESKVINMLSDFKQPITISNILAAESMMNKRGSMFKKLLGEENDDNELEEAVNNISNSITSKEDMTNAYEKLESVANSVIDKHTEEADVSSIDLKELKLLRNEIQLSTNLSREEKFEIPVKIGDEITSISLTLIRGSEQGKVTISMENETIGKAAAEFTLKGKNATGYIATDNQDGLNLLKDRQVGFESQLANSEITLNKVDYIASNSLDMSKWNNDLQSSGETSESSTKDLYSLARAFVVCMQED